MDPWFPNCSSFPQKDTGKPVTLLHIPMPTNDTLKFLPSRREQYYRSIIHFLRTAAKSLHLQAPLSNGCAQIPEQDRQITSPDVITQIRPAPKRANKGQRRTVIRWQQKHADVRGRTNRRHGHDPENKSHYCHCPSFGKMEPRARPEIILFQRPHKRWFLSNYCLECLSLTKQLMHI